MLTASFSPHVFNPYATLRRWPQVVPHRAAKATRAEGVMGDKKLSSGFNAGMPDYHHTVIDKSTPNVDFTNWCSPGQIEGMENEDAEIRRENLRRLIERDFGGNQSLFAREYWRVNDLPGQPRQSFINDLMSGRPDAKTGKPKSFAEKTARRVERAGKLLRGELDIAKSPLRLDQTHATDVADELQAEVRDLGTDPDMQREILYALREIKAKYRKPRRRAAG